MKKLVLMLCAVFMLGAAAQAQTILSPLYMPNQGQIVSHTDLTFGDTAQGDADKFFSVKETLTYSISDKFLAGAYIGYADYDDADAKDFTNPGIFAMYRALAEDITFDVGANIELGVFDNDVAAKNYRYSAFFRAGKHVDQLTFGLRGALTYTDWDESDADNDWQADLNGFAWYDLNEKFALGGVLGVDTNDLFGYTLKTGDLYVGVRGGFTINENMGVMLGGRYYFADGSDNNQYTITASFRAAFL